MPRKQYFVSPNGNALMTAAWKVSSGGVTIQTCQTQQEAIRIASQRAKRDWDVSKQPSQVMIQRPDGTFRAEYTYGNDPYPPPG